LLAHGQWFSPGTAASSTTKTGHHDIAVILLKVAFKHQKSLKIKSANYVPLKDKRLVVYTRNGTDGDVPLKDKRLVVYTRNGTDGEIDVHLAMSRNRTHNFNCDGC
jgi:hypothetical protein